MKHIRQLAACSVFLLLAAAVQAQDIATTDSVPAIIGYRFAYLDYDSVVMELPQYTVADIELKRLKGEYDRELEHSRAAFEHRYIEFMLEHANLSEPIVAKRQKELQTMLEADTQLRDELQRDLENKRTEGLEKLRRQVVAAAAAICTEMGLDYVVDSGSPAFLFVNPQRGIDISETVIEKVSNWE